SLGLRVDHPPATAKGGTTEGRAQKTARENPEGSLGCSSSPSSSGKRRPDPAVRRQSASRTVASRARTGDRARADPFRARAVLPMSARIWTAESLRWYGRLIAGRSAEREGDVARRPSPGPRTPSGEHEVARREMAAMAVRRTTARDTPWSVARDCVIRQAWPGEPEEARLVRVLRQRMRDQRERGEPMVVSLEEFDALERILNRAALADSLGATLDEFRRRFDAGTTILEQTKNPAQAIRA